MTKKYYVGTKKTKYELFLSETKPTADTHGDKYTAVIGPFQTKAGATMMAKFGYDNPHIRNVSEAEAMAKRHPEWLK